jgi:predicted secreted protein
MAVGLGKDIVSSYTGIANGDIRSVTITDECEQIDTTARGSTGGYKEFAASFTSKTVEIECLHHSTSVGATAGSMIVTAISCNEPLDDVRTYTITLKSN